MKVRLFPTLQIIGLLLSTSICYTPSSHSIRLLWKFAREQGENQMQDIYDTFRLVRVVAQKSESGAKYSIFVKGKQIHLVDDPNPPTAIGRLSYYKTARPALERYLKKIGKDAETICQELQISIMLATD